MAKKLITDIERVALKFDVDVNGCWVWNGKLDRDGYGSRVKFGSRTDGTRCEIRPHRWLFEYFNGPITEGLVTDHLCRNRACVNLDHLEIVTPQENSHRRREARTYCSKGHPYLGNNAVFIGAARLCRICSNEYQRVYQYKSRRNGPKRIRRKQEAESRNG